MEFKELLSIGRDLKREDCSIIRDCLEKVQGLYIDQVQIINILVKSGISLENAIQGIWDGSYIVYDNFYEYIDNILHNECNDIPDYIELDYNSMWYRTFRYDESLYIDWQELTWSKDRDEYGTNEQKEKQRAYIEYNLQYSKVIEFFY